MKLKPKTMIKLFLTTIAAAFLLSACAQTMNTNNNNTTMDTNEKVNKTEEEWKNILTPDQFYILREKGTEAPGTGKFLYNKEKGTYVCAGCGNELFTSDMKFDSHCGWPSFDREIAGGKITTKKDVSHGMVRTEIMCGKCGGHLGHIFDDGPTETGMRYCVNSLSLDFKKDSTEKK
jgi:methionine-R-sulfoxide reductase